MLLNEFLKAHRRIEEQEATVARLQNQIDAVTTGLQKVSALLAAASPSLADLKRANFPQDESAVVDPHRRVLNNP